MKKNVNIALNQVAVLGLLVKIEWFHISLQAIGPATCLQQPSNLQALQLCFKLKKKKSLNTFVLQGFCGQYQTIKTTD